MHKALVLIFVLFYPTVSFGCTVPRMGPEFDNLIEVEKTAKNTFTATFPKKAGKLDFGADVNVRYYPQDSEHRIGEYWKRVYAREDGNNYVATFELKKIEGHIPIVEVFWYPEYRGLCGAYGLSKDLRIE